MIFDPNREPDFTQLEKVLRQMIAASSGFYITAAEVAAVLQNEMRKVSALPPAVDLSGTLEDIERRVIEQVLREEIDKIVKEIEG